MESEPQRTFGEQLRRLRMAAGLTQEELAEQSGLSVRGISDLERGRRTNPHYDTVRLLAGALALNDENRERLLAAARPSKPSDAPLAPPEFVPTFPVPLTSLIGRDDDARVVAQLLDQAGVRLVNLTGPGGVGKTRLALEVAGTLGPQFPNGVYFVSMAALRDPDLLLGTVVHALGLQETKSMPPLTRLTSYLHERRLLLVLDNFEHLLPAAPLVSSLLAACPELKVLITSRMLLHLSGEHEYAVPPLALPEPGQPVDLERLRQIPAVALFVERLARSTPRSALAEADAPAIATICARLDGLPLAIELAAARARHLTLPELAARLQRRLPLLTLGQRDLPERQRTLRDTIAWSYDLLAPDVRRLLRWLSVFSGGWTLEHVEALCWGENGLPIDALDGLATLVESSLVRVERGADGRTRYGMLETIREFAEGELYVSGEDASVRHRHAAVMLAWSAQAERGLQSGERTTWSRIAVAEVDNVRAALRWSLDHRATERALRISGNLDWFWDAVARDGEGWAWSQAVLAQDDVDRNGLGFARALSAAGALAWNMGEFQRSSDLLTEAVAHLRTLGERRSLGQALMNLGLTRLYLGDVESSRACLHESVRLFEEVADRWSQGLALFVSGETLLPYEMDAARAAYDRSLAIFRSIGEPWGVAHAITGLGGLAMRRREYATARELMEEALVLRRSVNNRHAIASSLTSLGELARREGNDARAETYLKEGLRGFRDIGDAEHLAWTLYNLGIVALHRSDAAFAATIYAECLALRVEQGNAAEIAKTVAAVARVALLREDPERAIRLLGAAKAIRVTHGVATPVDEDGDEERRTLFLAGEALGDVAVAQLFAVSRALSQPEAIQFARQTLSAIEY